MTAVVKTLENSPQVSLLSNSEQSITPIPTGEPEWYLSGQILDFVRSVVSGADTRHFNTKNDGVVESLRQLLQAVERSTSASDLSFPKAKDEKQSPGGSMPPLDAAVAVLRWAKGVTHYISYLLKN